MRPGRRVAVDVGKARIGVAASDFHGILASGLCTISRKPQLSETITEILAAIGEVEPIEIYVGLPLNLQGQHTESTSDAILLARALAAATDCPVRFIDERMTTNTAANALRLSGRDAKSGRVVIDQIAATVILEQALAVEKSSAAAPGFGLEEIDED